MEKLNILGIETKNGYRTFELYNGDLSKLDREVDVLIVSAFSNNYLPIPHTLIGALQNNCNLSVMQLSQDPELDLSDSLGFWISKEIDGRPFKRILCVEILGIDIPISEIIKNLFIGLTIIEAKGFPVKYIALPIIGAGNQMLDPERILLNLIPAAKAYFERSQKTESLLFVEINKEYAMICSKVMNEILGRHQITIPHSQLLSSISGDVKNKVFEAQNLFNPGNILVREEWLRLCDSKEIRSFELGVLSRKFVEILIENLGISNGNLSQRIRVLEQSGSVAPWICGYMNVLRHIGNEQAHSGTHGTRVPPFVEEADLALTLMCVQRLLEFWIDFNEK